MNKKQLTIEVIEIILNSKWGKLYKFKKQSNWKRLGNLDKIPMEEFLKILNDLFGVSSPTMYSPRSGPNPSSKFNMFEFLYKGETIQIILSGGMNDGQKYEAQFLKRLQENTQMGLYDIQDKPIFDFYYSSSLDPKFLSGSQMYFSGTTSTSRSLNPDGPTNIGSTISDITIEENENFHYISLKNSNGHTFYNGGNVPFICASEHEIVVDEDKFNSHPEIAKIFEILNININKVISGLEIYGSDQKPDWESIIPKDKPMLINLLSSGFGYGYYYVKNKGESIQFIDIKTKDDAYGLVGEVGNIYIKYPGGSTKSCSVKIETKSKYFGEIYFIIDFRNASGKLLPLSLRIRTNQ